VRRGVEKVKRAAGYVKPNKILHVSRSTFHWFDVMKKSLIFLSLLSLLLLTGCSLAGDITPPPDYRPPATEPALAAVDQGPLYPIVAPQPEQGAPIYAEKCAPCHGEAGLGDGPQATKLSNPVTAIGDPEIARQSIPSEWYVVVRDGRMDRFMPGFTSLSDRQRWDVLAYVYTLSASQGAFERGQALYDESCAGCHGPDGQGDGPQAGGADMLDFTDQSAMAGKSTSNFYEAISAGMPPAMPAFEALLEEDRWTLAEYVRSLSFSTTGQPAAAIPKATALPEAALLTEATPAVTVTASLTGAITGKIVHGAGGEASEGLEVTLHGFDAMQLVMSDTTTVEPGGAFSFEHVELVPGRAFLATTKYEQVTYGSGVGTVQEGQDLQPLDITVYDSTTDTSGLSVDRMHIFFDFSTPGSVQVVEFYIISNTGKETVTAAEEGGPVLEWALPAGAENLQFQDGVLGERYLPTEDGFADTTQVRPNSGEYQVLFAFNMPYERKLELTQPVNLPVSDVVVLYPEGGVRLRSEMLRDDGTRDGEGVVYQVYSGGGLEAGSALNLTLSGRPGGGSVWSDLAGDQGSLVFGLGALGLALVVAGLLLYRRSQVGEPDLEEEGEDSEEDAGEETPDSLMDAILALDDLYQDRKLPEDAYQKRRAELKERLRDLQAG
jgi:mono/diheme cytochrome c family protein